MAINLINYLYNLKTMATEDKKQEEELVDETNTQENTENSQSDVETDKEEVAEPTTEEQLAEMKDKYLRLYSEFDNFRRRTAKERIELMGTATEGLMTSLVPIIDDFERGLDTMKKAEDVKSVEQGVELIFNKFKSILEGKGLKPMESAIKKEFDPELQEAITQIPAPSKKMKGKVVDVIEKGYYLNEKIIRFAKVVIGA